MLSLVCCMLKIENAKQNKKICCIPNMKSFGRMMKKKLKKIIKMSLQCYVIGFGMHVVDMLTHFHFNLNAYSFHFIH